MEVLVVVICVGAFLVFGFSLALAERQTRDVRARWDA